MPTTFRQQRTHIFAPPVASLVAYLRIGCRYEGENFVLDQQVIRASLKAFHGLLATTTSPTAASLSPSSFYLRLLLDKNLVPPELNPASWTQPATPILLLEWRAALLVHELAQTSAAPDATATQRVSRAVTEAFVAARVGEMIEALGSTFKQHEADVVRKVYLLVCSNALSVHGFS